MDATETVKKLRERITTQIAALLPAKGTYYFFNDHRLPYHHRERYSTITHEGMLCASTGFPFDRFSVFCNTATIEMQIAVRNGLIVETEKADETWLRKHPVCGYPWLLKLRATGKRTKFYHYRRRTDVIRDAKAYAKSREGNEAIVLQSPLLTGHLMFRNTGKGMFYAPYSYRKSA